MQILKKCVFPVAVLFSAPIILATICCCAAALRVLSRVRRLQADVLVHRIP